jgi:hypothetical protein
MQRAHSRSRKIINTETTVVGDQTGRGSNWVNKWVEKHRAKLAAAWQLTIAKLTVWYLD